MAFSFWAVRQTRNATGRPCHIGKIGCDIFEEPSLAPRGVTLNGGRMTTLTRAAREAARFAAAAARSAPASTSSSGRAAVADGPGTVLLLATTWARPNVWHRAAWRGRSTSTPGNVTAAARARMGLSPAPTGLAAEAIGSPAAGAAASARAASAAHAGGPVARLLATLRVYHDLSKFKLSAFVVSTAAAGYVLGSGETVNWDAARVDVPGHDAVLIVGEHVEPDLRD